MQPTNVLGSLQVKPTALRHNLIYKYGNLDSFKSIAAGLVQANIAELFAEPFDFETDEAAHAACLYRLLSTVYSSSASAV